MTGRVLFAFVVLCAVMIPAGLLIVPVLMDELGERGAAGVWWVVVAIVGLPVLGGPAGLRLRRRR